ncbi:MAG: 1-acyl-sn-glycerol-3-phosphate acyltransferase [Nitrospirae bacterium]|nr:1-acyl-sn-glycerol-3-phosphate acyltransferase [Nitrospirota bacterium]
MHYNISKKIKKEMGLIYRFAALIIRLIFHINGGLVVKGSENIPLEGGVIIAFNHLSFLDPLLAGAALPRRATFMARRELFNVPVLGWMAKHYALPVDKERFLPSTVKQSVKRLRGGEVVVIFPEGMRSKTGELLEAGQGVGMIALHGNVPIVPALITGSNAALPFDARWLKRAKVSVIFGKPIYFSKGEVADQRHSLYKDISDKVMYNIGRLQKRSA